MKRVLVIGDGMADLPLESLGGRTPLEAARMPHAARMAREGKAGTVRTIPPGLPPGSEVGIPTLLGVRLRAVPGRGALEAEGRSLPVPRGIPVLRASLCAVEGGRMEATSLSNPEAAALCEALNRETPGFVPGIGHRALFLGAAEEGLRPYAVLEAHPINAARRARGLRAANAVRFWGGGEAGFEGRLEGALACGTDLVKGIGRRLGMEVLDIPGATGDLMSDLGAKARAATLALERHDLVVVHVEAPDEAAHARDVRAKVAALERIDREVLGPLLTAADVLAFTSDHATSTASGEHLDLEVPVLVWGQGTQASSLCFDPGWTLLESL